MRRLIALVVALAFLVPSTAAFAQSTDGPKTQFVEFDEFLVPGERGGPSIILVEPKPNADFDKLRNLERSFMPELRESAQASALNN